MKMHIRVHFHLIVLCVFFLQVFTSDAIPCDSCGNECASACGTKNFRTCCFNYLRKRTDPNALKSITNKRLIDFILLQGRAMFTRNELSRAEEAKAKEQVAAEERERELARRHFDEKFHRNGTLYNVAHFIGPLEPYYD